MQARLMVFALVGLAFLSTASAENWPQWRGPYQNGVAAGQGFPTQWGEDKNIVWKVSIPGWGTSTPVIWDDHVFLTCIDEEENALICLNRDGKKQWLTHVGPTAGNRNRKASGANPSPVTDGKHVYVYYRSGEVVCVDFAGEIVWQQNLQEKHGPDQLWWDLGTSPVLTSQHVVIAVMHQGPSYLVALDKETGNETWKKDRTLDAPGEARDSYTTPLVVTDGGDEVVVVLGADHVTAHAAASGEEMWRVGGLNPEQQGFFRSIASPAVADGLILAPYARGETLTAIRPGGRGDVTESHTAWTVDIPSSDVPSPVSFEGNLYLCSDRGDVTCLNARTGEQIWSERLPRNRYPYSSSPVIADGRLYCTREDGTTFVLELDAAPKLVATNSLRENTYATPVFVDSQVFLRSSEYLFCIAER